MYIILKMRECFVKENFISARRRHFVDSINVNLKHCWINPLTPELNPSAQRCLTSYFTGDFASWIVHFVSIYLKNQEIHQLFIQFINCVWYLLHVSALHCHLQEAFLVSVFLVPVSSDVVRMRTTSLDTTRPSTIFYRLLLNCASLRRH
jgi:hypothetical protein